MKKIYLIYRAWDHERIPAGFFDSEEKAKAHCEFQNKGLRKVKWYYESLIGF